MKRKFRYSCRMFFSFQNPVSLKLSDDRYIVLSFVLCGCIAGILLASVIVFLIRRNSRSKQKLAQLSGATGEGNEPSQDYQVSSVCCRCCLHHQVRGDRR